MKGIYVAVVLLSIFLILPITVLAITNLDFRIEVEDKIYFPNETIPVNVSVQNRDVSFDANDVVVSMKIGKRTFDYEFGDIKSQKSVLEDLTLPEYPPGDYVIKGELNFTDFFGEIETIEIFNSFHVRFPEIERLPRNVVIKDFIIPEEMIAGETHKVSIKVSNEGTISGDLLIELSSMGVSKSKKIHLDAGETETVNLDVEFYNPGVSKVEGRVYGLVGDEKYLLAYDVTDVFVKESNVAKLSFERTELVNEANNQINQNDIVKLKIYLKNSGNWMASNVKGKLSSSVSGLEITQSEGIFGVIAKNDLSSTIFEIKSSDSKIGPEELTLNVLYSDGIGDHETSFQIPLNISEGEDSCQSNDDCLENQLCSDNKCIDIPCDCGEIVNRKCVSYSCCSDLDCEEDYICSDKTHNCEPSQQIKADVLIVTSNKLKTDKEYNDVLKGYRETILKEGLTSFYILVDSPKVQELFNIKPADTKDWKSVKNVLDKIIYKIKPDYLLILGGVDIIPQPPAKTEAEIPAIPVSDDRYSDINLDGIPDIATGRMPSPSGGSIQPIIEGLNSAIRVHKSKAPVSKVVFADTCGTPPTCVGLEDVNHITEILFDKGCYDVDECKPNPPYCTDLSHPFACSRKDVVYDLFGTRNFIFINAHGSPWTYSAHGSDDKWYQLIKGSKFYEIKLNGNPFVSTVACHSGTIDCEEYGCIDKNGVVFSLLNNGASAYIANTRYGYFGTSPKLIGLIFKNLKDGDSLGNALLKMKQEKLKDAWSDWYRAVIYEIQLYGDPTIKLIGV